MSVAKYNKGLLFNVETKGFKFYKLKDIYQNDSVKYYIKGLVIFNTQYGDSANAILEDKFVNLPNHMVMTVREMLNDDELIQNIKADKVGFTIRQYEDVKHGAGKCYGITWFED